MSAQAMTPSQDDAIPDDSEAAGEPTTARFRYPGSAPFEDTDVDRLLFHGRDLEIETVLHSILSFDLFLVYSTSGMGKTSLLTAGVLHHLRNRNLWPIILRLNDPTTPPMELVAEQIRQAGETSTDIVVGRNPNVPALAEAATSLWEVLSGLEVWRGNTLQQPVLIFDQFEELFTLGWDDDDRERFITSFGEVVRRHRTAPSVNADQVTRLPPPNVKIVLLVREDSIGELERLAIDVPQILQNRFRLEGLDPAQAKKAIQDPAQIHDARLTSQFGYSEEAAATILDFLRTRQDRDRTVVTRSVDPSQLQIICEHIERTILPAKRAAAGSADPLVISEADLGGRAGLERILRDFYRNKLQLFASKERKRVRTLCETGLISQHRRRLSLEEGEIGARFKVPPSVLEKLVAHRLVRAEPRVSSVYYELAHDTLVKPILAYRDADRVVRRKQGLLLLGCAVLVLALGGLMWSRGESDGARSLDLGVVVQGATALDDDDDAGYEFDSRGQSTLVMALPDSNLDAVLELTDPSGNTTQIDRGRVGEFEFEVAPAGTSGRYHVGVHAADASVSSFALSVNPASVFKIHAGDRVGGSLAKRDDVDLFEFDGTAGDTFLISVSPDAEFDVMLAVTRPNGTSFLVDAGEAGETEIAFTDSEESGTFRIAVWGYERTSRTYSIAITPASSVSSEDGIESGTVDGDELRFFEFQSSPGEASQVVVTPDEALDVVLTLAGADGVSRIDTGGAGQVEFAVTDIGFDGTYRMVVDAADSSTGAFDVEVRPLDVVTSGLREGVQGSIEGRGDVRVFEFDVRPDSTSRITVTPDAEFDVVFQVTGPGTDVTVNNRTDGGAEQYSATVGEGSARFRVVVRGFQARAGGFTFSVEEVVSN